MRLFQVRGSRRTRRVLNFFCLEAIMKWAVIFSVVVFGSSVLAEQADSIDTVQQQVEKRLGDLREMRQATLMATYLFQAADEALDLRNRIEERGAERLAQLYTYSRICGGYGHPELTFFEAADLPEDTTYPFLYESLCQNLASLDASLSNFYQETKYEPNNQERLDAALVHHEKSVQNYLQQFYTDSSAAVVQINQLAELEYQKIGTIQRPE